MITTTEPVCRLDDLLPERPVAALIDGRQVAIPRDRIAKARLHEDPEGIGAKRGARGRHA